MLLIVGSHYCTYEWSSGIKKHLQNSKVTETNLNNYQPQPTTVRKDISL